MGGQAALALSGGIDSAILARMMPEGSTAYTFKCVVPGVEVTDETPAAARVAQMCGLRHKIVEVYWEDFEAFTPVLMRRKKAPTHSIEVQIYKAALQARKDGFDALIFGESADAVYGGQDNILSKDYTVGAFIDRFSYVMPHWALKDPAPAFDTFRAFARDGKIDPYEFMSGVYFYESVGSYINACRAAEMDLLVPYGETCLAEPLDYSRVRNGEPKYLVREVFQRLFPGEPVPAKVPMPRPMGEWLKDWTGPVRDEFWPHCATRLTGDQKWLLWALEQYLNMTEA